MGEDTFGKGQRRDIEGKRTGRGKGQGKGKAREWILTRNKRKLVTDNER